jgi:hypothetical protein
MSTHTIEQRLDDLTLEVRLLRSAVIGLIAERDPEGEYRPEFVRRILKARKESPTFTYQGKNSLLKQLKNAK